MDTEKMHIGAILSIVTPYLLAPDGMAGVYVILNYMTGDSLYAHQLGRARGEVRPYILALLPWLSEPDAREEMDRLERTLPLLTDDEARTQFVDGFVKGFALRFGEYHELMPVPFSVSHHDPLTELETMVPKERIMVISVDPEKAP